MLSARIMSTSSDPDRYIENNPSTLLTVDDPEQYFLQYTTKVLQSYPPRTSWPDDELRGIYKGPTALAFFFFDLAQKRPQADLEGNTPLDWCLAYLTGRRKFFPLAPQRRGGIFCEELAYHAVSAVALPDKSVHLKRFEELCILFQEECVADEWCVGRAGVLYFIRLVEKYASQATVDRDIVERLRGYKSGIIEKLLENGTTWTLMGKEYIGAAHGSIGIITQIVLSDASFAPQLEMALSSLLDQQTANGHWISHVPNKQHSEGQILVQFCHGAPGFVISLLAILPYFPTLKDRIGAAIERGRECIWREGLLTKGPNLCHGTTGNALALASPQREHFMAYSTPKMIETGVSEGWLDEKDVGTYGLWTGDAGRAWAWMYLANGGAGGLLGYTDI